MAGPGSLLFLAQFCKVPEVHDDVTISGKAGSPLVPDVYRMDIVSLQGCPLRHDEIRLDLDIRVLSIVVEDGWAESKQFILAQALVQQILVRAEVLLRLFEAGLED
ncbi:MAG: hypothetical protein ACE10F_00920 [Candidatus Methylomirabilales bacterium]